MNITTNGTYPLTNVPGTYQFTASGTFGSGTVTFQYADGDDWFNYNDGISDMAYTAKNAFKGDVAQGARAVVSGATSPALKVNAIKLKGLL